VVIDGRAYVMTYDGPNQRGGSVAAFRAFADTIRFDVSPPATPGDPTTTTFTSAIHGYSIAYPADCTALAATEPWVPGEKLWAGPQAWDRSPHVDRFCGESETFTVASTLVPDGVDPSAWVAGLRPHGGTYCREPAGRGWIPPKDFEQSTIAGRPAFLRPGCGFVDGVVFVNRQAYVMTYRATVGIYHGPAERRADLEAFRALADTMRFGVLGAT
jgi:hypothetical protein